VASPGVAGVAWNREGVGPLVRQRQLVQRLAVSWAETITGSPVRSSQVGSTCPLVIREQRKRRPRLFTNSPFHELT
jgi:hypothetical protein